MRRRIWGAKRPADVPPIPAHVRLRQTGPSPDAPYKVFTLRPDPDPVVVERVTLIGVYSKVVDARRVAGGVAALFSLPFIDETKGEHTRAMFGNV